MRSGTDKPDNLESLLIIIIRLNRLTQAKERLEKQEGKVLKEGIWELSWDHYFGMERREANSLRQLEAQGRYTD